MNIAPERSIDDLRNESEKNREALVATVGELRDRVGEAATELKTITSPGHIKQEFRAFVQRERETLTQSLQRRARDNPLQVAAVAAAAAYPMLRVARALPAPVWLIGAGLFLTSNRGRAAADSVRERAEDYLHEGSEKAAEVVSTVQSNLAERTASLRHSAEDAGAAVVAAVDKATDKARAALHDARDSISGMAGTVGSEVSSATRHVRSSIAGSNSSGDARQAVRDAGRAASDFVNNNALLIGGLGILAGAVIAASIPSSDAENRLFGSASKKLRSKASESAAQGVDALGSMAAEAATAASVAAARQGLTSGNIKDKFAETAQIARAVADRGLNSAFGSGEQPSTGNGNSATGTFSERTPS